MQSRTRLSWILPPRPAQGCPPPDPILRSHGIHGNRPWLPQDHPLGAKTNITRKGPRPLRHPLVAPTFWKRTASPRRHSQRGRHRRLLSEANFRLHHGRNSLRRPRSSMVSWARRRLHADGPRRKSRRMDSNSPRLATFFQRPEPGWFHAPIAKVSPNRFRRQVHHVASTSAYYDDYPAFRPQRKNSLSVLTPRAFADNSIGAGSRATKAICYYLLAATIASASSKAASPCADRIGRNSRLFDGGSTGTNQRRPRRSGT